MSFNLSSIISKSKVEQYQKRIQFLKKIKKWDTSNIEQTVEEVHKNVLSEGCQALVLYGEPQSGKTETMIALTAKLLDSGKKHILLLVTDHVQLRDQNLREFAMSGLSPTPQTNKDFLRDIKENNLDISKSPFIIFCKKNGRELRELLKDTKIKDLDDLVIIDDEADYATPNSKINKKLSGDEKEQQSVINELINKMMNTKGVWIGVTATPGRLDLNNTMANDNHKWVYLPAHSGYYGQYNFFPPKFRKIGHKAFDYNVKYLGDSNDDPSFLKESVFRFLVKVSKRNIEKIKNDQQEDFYSMVVHTSTGKDGHKNDFKNVNENIFKPIKEESKNYPKVMQELHVTAIKMYQDENLANEILNYIYENKNKYNLIVMNSDKDMKSQNFDLGTKPITPFTIIFGGNIISRGLTFHGLLSMFFSRTTKHKMDKGTYIQRARMFGNRKEVFRDFELTIPESLYFDWFQVFKEHREDLATITGESSPLWHSSKRTKTTAPGSIDKANVEQQSGELRFKIFKLTDEIVKVYESGLKENKLGMIKKLFEILGPEYFPKAFYDDVADDKDSERDSNIYIQNILLMSKEKYNDAIVEEVRRVRGGHINGHDSGAEYWFAMYKNKKNYARIFYRSYFNRTIISHLR